MATARHSKRCTGAITARSTAGSCGSSATTAAADDALVEAFWRAYRSRARFNAARPFGAWMRRIATNAAVDQLRAMTRRPAQYDGRDIAAPGRPDGDVAHRIAQAVRELSPKLRLVAILGLIEERQLAEIADALDVPVGNGQVASLPRNAGAARDVAAAGNSTMTNRPRDEPGTTAATAGRAAANRTASHGDGTHGR
jgi:RNA polymerase sigma factor (sigma-70 family)